jgi:hypothetical protein
MAPLKPPANFKFKHFLVDPSSNSKYIVAKTSILLPPFLKPQNGSNKSLVTTSASSLGTTIGVEKPISIYYDPIVPKPKKAMKAKRELNRVFQDIWATKLPWVEAMIHPNGKLSMVKCKVCNFVEKRKKLFIPKFDGLQNYVRQRKAIVAKPDVKVGEHFMSLNNPHVKNECDSLLQCM